MNFTGNINDINIQLKRLNNDLVNQQKTIAYLTTLIGKKTIVINDGIPAITDDSLEISSINGLTDQLNNKSSILHSHEVQEFLQSGAATGQVIRWTGTEWAPETIETAGGFEIDGGNATVYSGLPDINGGGA